MNNLKSLLESVEVNFNIYNANKNPKTTSSYKKSLLALQRETQLLRRPLTASKKPVSHGLVEPPKVAQPPLLVPVQLPVNTAEVLNPPKLEKKKSKRKAPVKV
jgi:hypothetical protein